MEKSEERFENYFHFLSSRKNWDGCKAKDEGLLSKSGYPQMYSVYLLRSNKAPLEFVVKLIQKFFHKNKDDAERLAMEVMREDRVLCETYTRDTAETKVMHVLEFSQGQQQDVKCIMQKSGSHVIKKS